MPKIGNIGPQPQWGSPEPIKGQPTSRKFSLGEEPPPDPLPMPKLNQGKQWLEECTKWLKWSEENFSIPINEKNSKFISQLQKILQGNEFQNSMGLIIGNSLEKKEILKTLDMRAEKMIGLLNEAKDLAPDQTSYDKLTDDEKTRYKAIILDLHSKLVGTESDPGINELFSKL